MYALRIWISNRDSLCGPKGVERGGKNTKGEMEYRYQYVRRMNQTKLYNVFGSKFQHNSTRTSCFIQLSPIVAKVLNPHDIEL